MSSSKKQGRSRNSSLIRQKKVPNPQQQLFIDACRKIIAGMTSLKENITLHLDSLRTLREQLRLAEIRAVDDAVASSVAAEGDEKKGSPDAVAWNESVSAKGLVHQKQYAAAEKALIDSFSSALVIEQETDRLKAGGMISKFPTRNFEIASGLFRKLGSLLLLSNDPYRAVRIYLLALTIHPNFSSSLLSTAAEEKERPSNKILTMWCLYFLCLIRGGLWKLASRHGSILESFDSNTLPSEEESHEVKILRSLFLWIRLHDRNISDKTDLVKTAVSLLRQALNVGTKNFESYRLQALLLEIVSDACRLPSSQWTGVHQEQEQDQEEGTNEEKIIAMLDKKICLNSLGLLDESGYKLRSMLRSIAVGSVPSTPSNPIASTSSTPSEPSASSSDVVGLNIDFSSPKFSNSFDWSAMDTVSFLCVLQREGRYFLESGVCRDAVAHFSEAFTLARRLAYPSWNYCILTCKESLQSSLGHASTSSACFSDMKSIIYGDDHQSEVPSLDKKRVELKELVTCICSTLNLGSDDEQSAEAGDAMLEDVVNHPLFFGHIGLGTTKNIEDRSHRHPVPSLGHPVGNWDEISFIYVLLEAQYDEFVEKWRRQVRGLKSLKDLIVSVESVWTDYFDHLLFYPLRPAYAQLLAELYRTLILNETLNPAEWKKGQHWKLPLSNHMIDADLHSFSSFLTTSTTSSGDLDWSLWYYLNESLATGLRQRAFILRKELKKMAHDQRFPFAHIQGPPALRRLVNHHLPADWTINHIHLTDFPGVKSCEAETANVDSGPSSPLKRLWICRYTKTTDGPFDRPLICSKIIPGSEEERVRRKIREMYDRNESSMVERDKQRFWRARKSVDADIQELLAGIEADWLGEWKYLLIPSPSWTSATKKSKIPPPNDSFTHSLTKMEWTPFGISLLSDVSRHFGGRLSKELTNQQQHLTNYIQQLIKMDWAFFPSTEKKKKGRTGSARSASKRLVSTSDTQEEEKKKESVVEGTKELLQIESLSLQFTTSTALMDSSEQGNEDENDDDLRGGLSHLSTILILSNELHEIGWESLPMHLLVNNNFSGGQFSHGISRMMSVHFLIRSLQMMKKPNDACGPDGDDGRRLMRADKTFYVLNPENDLKQTQLNFERPFRRQTGWKGLAGSPPSASLMKSVLQQNHLLVYCGHGSGSRFIGSTAILDTGVCRAVVLLMGCSSIRLKTYGNSGHSRFEPRGVLHDYILSNCPSIVGCLWGVTDRDIDKFLMGLLQQWLSPPCSFTPPDDPSPQTSSVSASSSKSKQQLASKPDCHKLRELNRSLKAARSVTKLNYLTGAAPVSYGLPIFNSYSL